MIYNTEISSLVNINSLWQTLIGFIICYFIGSIIFANIIGKLNNVDIYNEGSNNPGASNIHRVLGKKYSIIVFILDFLKTPISFLIISLLNFSVFDSMLVPVALFGAVIGHIFPIYNKFKGGKGIATALGYILIVNWVIGLIALLVWVIILKLSKYISIASISAVVIAIILALIPQLHNLIVIPQWYESVYPDGYWWITALSISIVSIIIVFKHSSNIKRLLNKGEFKSDSSLNDNEKNRIAKDQTLDKNNKNNDSKEKKSN